METFFFFIFGKDPIPFLGFSSTQSMPTPGAEVYATCRLLAKVTHLIIIVGGLLLQFPSKETNLIIQEEIIWHGLLWQGHREENQSVLHGGS